MKRFSRNLQARRPHIIALAREREREYSVFCFVFRVSVIGLRRAVSRPHVIARDYLNARATSVPAKSRARETPATRRECAFLSPSRSRAARRSIIMAPFRTAPPVRDRKRRGERASRTEVFMIYGRSGWYYVRGKIVQSGLAGY